MKLIEFEFEGHTIEYELFYKFNELRLDSVVYVKIKEKYLILTHQLISELTLLFAQ